MQLIERWFEKKKRASQQIVSVFEGILRKDFLTYIYFRLRYLSYTTLIRSFILMIEFYFLLYFVHPTASINIALFRMIGMAITGFWWGLLESLRTELRTERKTGERVKMPIVIQHWLTLSFCIAILLLLIGFIAFFISLKMSGLSRLELFYLLAILLHVATGIIVRTVHSSIFALTRISRPLLSVNFPQIIGLCFLFILYPLAKQYSLAWAYIIEAFLAVSLTLYYTMRMDRILMLLPKVPLRWQGFPSFLMRATKPDLFLPGIASLLFSIQPVFIYLLVDEGYTFLTFSLSMMIFLISPQMNATFEWTRLFYFDMKKLAQPGMRHFEQYMHQQLKSAAIWVGIGAWVISTALITFFYHERIYLATLLLLPVFIVRSLNSHMEMRLFCDFYYYDVIISGLIFAVGYLIFEYLPREFTINQDLLIVLTLYVISLLYVYRPRLKPFRHDIGNILLGFYAWLNQVKNIKGDVVIFNLYFDKNANAKSRHEVISALLANHLVCMPRQHRLLIAVRTSSPDTIYAEIIKMGAGQLTRLLHTEVCKEGRIAIHRAIQKNFILVKSMALDLNYLISIFTRHFPHGQYLAMDDKAKSQYIELASTEEYGALYKAVRKSYGSPYDLITAADYFVTTLLQSNNITHIFVLPKNTELDQVMDWKMKVISYNIINLLKE